MQCLIGRYGFNGGNTAGIRVKSPNDKTPSNFRVQADFYIQGCIDCGDDTEAFDFIMTSIFFRNDKKKNDEYRTTLLERFLPWLFD